VDELAGILMSHIPNLIRVHDHGYWITDGVVQQQYFDEPLAAWLSEFFQGKTVIDLGCGQGRYVTYLRERSISCVGYDGNPTTDLVPYCHVVDLVTADISLRSDWVLSLEVAEHIPPQYEYHYLKQIHYRNSRGIVISWAHRGQDGCGHVNCRDEEEVKLIMELLGYKFDDFATNNARNAATVSWYQQNILIFRKQAHQPCGIPGS
jgi:hypothetical protein